MILLFANNAESSIAAPINAAATTVQLAAGDGLKFPNPLPGQQFFKLTFVDALTGLVNEIVNVTARNGDVLTIVRAQENTLARPWLAGDAAKNMTTAQTQDNFIQVEQAQENFTNYARDSGTPNSYVIALTPAVTTRKEGLYARIKALNTNTGPSTLNLGAGSFPILNPDGSQLGANAIVAAGIFEVVDDGVAGYQLISASQEAQSGAGLATTGDMKWRPTNETIDGWVIANTLTVGNVGSGAGQLASAAAVNIFTWLWNNFSNTQCPIFTSTGQPTTRGVNAVADFAALKQIAAYDMRGRGAIGVDTMRGPASTFLNGVPVQIGSTTGPSSLIGENLHALIANELAIHAHGNSLSDPSHLHGNSLSDPSHAHGISISNQQGGASFVSTNGFSTGNQGVGGGGGFGIAGTPAIAGAFTGMGLNNAGAFTGMGINNANAGGNAPHNNVALSAAGTWFIKI
jgi:hypothetical protein